jgi:hypothetical protein
VCGIIGKPTVSGEVVDMAEILVYCHGRCDPKDSGGYAVWAWSAMMDGHEIRYQFGCLGYGKGMTHREAEEEAVRQALRRAREKHLAITVYTGAEWLVKEPMAEIAEVLQHTGSTLAWIDASQNKRAQALTRLAHGAAVQARVTEGLKPTRQKQSG